MTELTERLLAEHQRCKEQRQTLESLWDQMADVYRPQRSGFISQRQPGDQRMQRVYDGEQIEAVTEFAHYVESATTPRGVPWVEIGTQDEIETKDDEASVWLAEASKVTLDRIYEGHAGFQAANNQSTQDLVVFGAGPIYMSMSKDMSSFLFRAPHLRDVHWWRDEAGLPQSVFYRCELRAEEAAKRWGVENLSPDTRKLLTEDDGKRKDTKVEFIEVTKPRDLYVVGSMHPRDTPIAAYVVEVKAKHLVLESGYRRQPWVIPEWEVLDNGDIWSLGRRALPDVLVLQQMAKTVLRQAQKMVDPPWMAAGDGIFNRFSTSPGAINYFDPSALSRLGGQKLVEQLSGGGDMQLGLDMQDRQRQKVGAIFLRNVLRLPDKNNMTATEVLRLNADLVRMTDSPFGRLETNKIQPLVEWAFNQLLAESVALRFGPGSPFRPLPEALSDATVTYKFLSPVARAREAANTAQFATWLESMAPLIQLKPEVLDNIDTDAVVRDFTSRGMAPKYLRPMDQVQELRKARQDLAAQQNQLDQVHQGAQAAGAVAPLMKVVADQASEAKRLKAA